MLYFTKPKLFSIICRLILTCLTAALTAAMKAAMTTAMAAAETAVIIASLSPTLQNESCSIFYVDSSRHGQI